MRKRNVVSKIKKAFAEVPMPSPENLMQFVRWPFNPNPGSDAEFVARAFAGRRWDDLSPVELRTGSDAFGLMTTEGVHYYLPAFMTQTLENPVEMDFEVDATIWYLSPPPLGYDDTLGKFEEKLAFLTQAQREAVAMFFTYLSSHPGRYGTWSVDPNNQTTTYWQSDLTDTDGE